MASYRTWWHNIFSRSRQFPKRAYKCSQASANTQGWADPRFAHKQGWGHTTFSSSKRSCAWLNLFMYKWPLTTSCWISWMANMAMQADSTYASDASSAQELPRLMTCASISLTRTSKQQVILTAQSCGIPSKSGQICPTVAARTRAQAKLINTKPEYLQRQWLCQSSSLYGR